MQEIGHKSYNNNQDCRIKMKRPNKFKHQQVNQHIVSTLQTPILANSTHENNKLNILN